VTVAEIDQRYRNVWVHILQSGKLTCRVGLRPNFGATGHFVTSDHPHMPGIVAAAMLPMARQYREL
jgi:hypothetical protein